MTDSERKVLTLLGSFMRYIYICILKRECGSQMTDSERRVLTLLGSFVRYIYMVHIYVY